MLDSRQLTVSYRNRSDRRAKKLVLNPLGVVVRDGVVYLVATAVGYEDVCHYALHRMRKATTLNQPATAPRGFRLADHVQADQRFSYPVSREKLALRALFEPSVGVHLTESRLSDDHRATPQDDGRLLIEATVSDTADLRWWLRSFGADVEVVAPASLREEFAATANLSAAMYASRQGQ